MIENLVQLVYIVLKIVRNVAVSLYRARILRYMYYIVELR